MTHMARGRRRQLEIDILNLKRTTNKFRNGKHSNNISQILPTAPLIGYWLCVVMLIARAGRLHQGQCGKTIYQVCRRKF